MTSHGFINNESCSACPDDAGNVYKVKRKDKQTNKQQQNPLMPHLMGTSLACIYINVHPSLSVVVLVNCLAFHEMS